MRLQGKLKSTTLGGGRVNQMMDWNQSSIHVPVDASSDTSSILQQWINKNAKDKWDFEEKGTTICLLAISAGRKNGKSAKLLTIRRIWVFFHACRSDIKTFCIKKAT